MVFQSDTVSKMTLFESLMPLAESTSLISTLTMPNIQLPLTLADSPINGL